MVKQASEHIESGVSPTADDWPGGPILAVLLDVDGTLYRPRPLQLRMAFELLLLPLSGRSIRGAVATWRIIAAFRRLREGLRGRPFGGEPLDRVQYLVASAETGLPIDEVEQVVRTWIQERPLRHLIGAALPGVAETLDAIAERGAKVGFLSDYPVAGKVRALGLGRHLESGVAFCTTDEAIGMFKPDPRGFEVAAEMLGLPPAAILYVGDRPSVDAAGAVRAGMPCAIIAAAGSRRFDETGRHAGARAFEGYAALWNVIERWVAGADALTRRPETTDEGSTR